MPITNSFSRFTKSIIVLFFFILLIAVVPPVHADVAPPGPPTSANPVPEFETQVRMVSETVTMDIDADSPYDEGRLYVTAEFTMRNMGDTPESMMVRFPLVFQQGFNYCEASIPSFYDESQRIQNFQAWVNNTKVVTNKTNETVPDRFDSTKTEPLPCWEYFLVNFPPNQDVLIKIKYNASPYILDRPNSYNYFYILETGQGWYDTIGSADIYLNFPYSVDQYNLYSAQPQEYTITENQIHWHLENFEPESKDNIDVSVFPPPLWQRALLEIENIDQIPNDSEAWGRLGKAYKEGIISAVGKGFPADTEEDNSLYQRSKQAYQKALELRPNDVDWHYGYAELLCYYARWGHNNFDNWQACFAELKQTLDLYPVYEKWLELAQEYAVGNEAYFTFDGNTPNFLILTPQPTPTITPTIFFPSPTQTQTATPRPTNTVTALPPTATTLPPSPTPFTEIIEEPQTAFPWTLPILLLSAGLIIWVFRRFKK